MRAAVYHGRQDVRVEDVSCPKITTPTDVILDVVAAGICGTDAAEWTSGPHFVPLDRTHPGSNHTGPTVLGHEFVGRVTETGSQVTAVNAGDLVVCGGGSWCGHCRWCLAGRYNLCKRWWVIGLHGHGGLAEQVWVPQHTLVPVPVNMPPTAAVLAQPLAVAVHALARARVQPGMSIAVIGAGAVGSLAVAAAAAGDPAHLAVTDVDRAALERARRLGATASFLATAADVVPIAHEHTGGVGFDIVIETSGTRAGLEQATELVARGGAVVLVGLQQAPATLDLHQLVLREVTVQTSNSLLTPTDLPVALAVLDDFDIAPILVGGVIALEDIVEDGLRPLAERSAAGKIVVLPPNINSRYLKKG